MGKFGMRINVVRSIFRLFAFSLFLITALGFSQGAFAQQTFTKARISSAGPYQTGQDVTYSLQGSCSNLISGCGTLVITDNLPPGLVVGTCPSSSFFGGVNGSIVCTATQIVLTRTVYAGGDTFSTDIVVRVSQALTTAQPSIVNSATAVITGFTNPSSAAPISVAAPTPQYVVRKQRTDPNTSLAISAGTAVTYNVQLCSISGTGNMPITGATLTDTLPTTTPALTAASVEVLGGGTLAFPSISWTLTAGDVSTLHTGTGCVNRGFVVRYPAGIAVSSVVTNTINGTVTPAAGAAPVIGPATRVDTIGAAAPDGTSSKSAPDVAPGTGDIVFSINANTSTSNARIPNFAVVDRLPTTPLAVGLTFASVSSGQWSSPTEGSLTSDVRATIQYTTAAVVGGVCDFTGATAIATNIASPAVASVFAVPGTIPANATCIRWLFTDAGTGGPNMPRNWQFNTPPQVRYSVNAGTVTVPSALQNCTGTTFTGAITPRPEQCVNARVEAPTPSVAPAKSFSPSTATPGGTMDITMTANHVVDDSTAPLTGIILSDWLPVQLEYVSFISSTPGGQVVQVTPNYGGLGRTLVRVSYPALSVPVGSAGPSATFRVQVREGVLSNPSYVNDMAVFLGPGVFTCPNNTAPIVDTNDLNNNGSSADLRCSTTGNFAVTDTFALGGEKWVEGDTALPNVDDPVFAPIVSDNTNCPDYDTNFGGPAGNFTRLPCVAQTTHGGAFRYKLRLANAGNRLLEEYVAYDTIPFIGDVGVGEPLSTQARDTRWVPTLNGAITASVVVPPLIAALYAPGTFATYATDARVQIEYTTNGNFCRGEVRNADFAPSAVGTAALINSFPVGCNAAATFSTTLPTPASLVRGFRIRAFSTLTAPASAIDWIPGTYIEVNMPLLAPATGAPPSYVGGAVPNVLANASFYNPAWNSLAHRVFRAAAAVNTDLLPTAEPPKVGIILPERYRLGNLVWLDNGGGNATLRNNGQADVNEPGINGVNVRLCRDTDGTAGASAGDTVVGNVATATLGGELGKYQFNDLAPGANYYLAITDAANQVALAGRRSTLFDELLPNTDADNTDNGIGINGAGLVTACGAGATGSIISGLVALGPVSAAAVPPEPTNEVLRVGGVDDDADVLFFDPASNFSVDFGFIEQTDLGDLPDGAAGVGAGNYQTLLADNGAVHPILNATRLGTTVDAELNGQPNVTADLDDTTGAPDDEDGVAVADLTQFETIAAPVNVNYNAANASRICGFIDYNNDGAFTGVELAQADVVAGAGNVTLNFGPVPVASAGNRYARFRISSGATVCSASGSAVDGEVEDYVVQVFNAADFGDLPDTAVGTGAGNYNTTRLDNGAGHVLRAGLRMGACNDAETNGQPILSASGDDTGVGVITQGTCAVANDDEDGINVADLVTNVGNPAVVRVTATNTVGVPAQICGFYDFNADGDFADAGETAAAVPVPTGSNGVVFNVSFGTVPVTAAASSYARFRLSSTIAPCSPTGLLTDGEVEDYVAGLNINDRGDLPDTGVGVGVGNYRTTIADGGPFHPIVAGLFLGAANDGELDGQPNATATGDDIAVLDDEDGVDINTLNFIVGQPRSVAVRATNTTGTDARLCGFVDFNGDGQFVAGAETAFATVPTGSNNVLFNLAYTKPLNSPSGNTYARFRISTDTTGACADSGAATNGEVEDYSATLFRIDLGDLPDTAVGTNAGNYNTLVADNGAQHEIKPGIFLGASVDNEADGQPNGAADGDDTSGTPDDEDGINIADLTLSVGANATIRATATNVFGVPAQICGFVDFNADGDFLDANESAPAVPVPNGTSNVVFPLNFGTVAPTTATTSYARFRIATTIAPCTAVGSLIGGEVEDYRVTIFNSDRGDLPDTGTGIGPGNYRTLIADGGPTHPIVAGLRLGLLNDGDIDGQPNAGATGDDAAVSDDEDGVDLNDLNFFVGQPRNVPVIATNTTGTAATLCGFVDFNLDGQFAGGAEIQQVAVPTGSVNSVFNLAYTKPLNSPSGATYARFRISTDVTPCAEGGAASNGEVEDYSATLFRYDLGDLPDTAAGTGVGNYNTLIIDGGAQHEIKPGIFLGASVDNEANGQPNVTADGDDTTGTPDDEDGINASDLTLSVGSTAIIRATATNTFGVPAQICGFVDFNADGDFLDAGESAPAVAVPNGSSSVVFPLNFGAVAPTAATLSYARFRLSTLIAPCTAVGTQVGGEVEDYRVTINNNDRGDLPDTGAGVGVGNYRTLIADGGPSHPIVVGLRMGALNDGEGDGQQTVTADGDDLAVLDDEDGVDVATLQFIVGQPKAVNVTATNTTALPARICAFIDFNRDGTFTAGPEVQEVAVPAGSNNVLFALNFTKPLSSPSGNTYARFRLSTDITGACVDGGVATNGEVEDYVVGLRRIDLGDLPDTSAGIGIGNYSTLVANLGAQHDIVPGLFMGATVDNEADGQPNATALGDDATGTPDDEDGVTVSDLTNVPALAATPVRVTATNTTGTAAKICGFVDFNADGDFLDAGEAATQAVPAASTNVVFTLAFGAVLPSGPRTSYARFRLSTSTAACSPDGALLDGEVEDYAVSFQDYDFGDLPDAAAGTGVGNYQTLFADSGAAHGVIAGLRIGAVEDAELVGQPNVAATGDDNVGTPDDEDGVTLRPQYFAGSPSTTPAIVTNTTGRAATLCGFIDWNGDGDFGDLNEATSLPVPTGSTNVSFLLNFGVVPVGGAGSTYGRFRLSTVPGCSATGLVADGEVEDYAVSVGIGAMSLGNLVWEDLNNDGLVSAGEPGIGGVPVSLFIDADNNGVPDGAAIQTQNTSSVGASTGNYLFINLRPNTYIVEITPPVQYTVSTGTGRRYLATGPYEPAPDPDNDINNDDNGTTNAVVNYRSLPVTLVAKSEPIDDGDADFDSNLSVDFGLLTNFDLALRKTLATGQPVNVTSGSDVRFTIIVFNQGSIAATNIEVTDTIPTGMALNDAAWTMFGANQAKRTIAGPLAPGANAQIDITLRIAGGAGLLRNTAEISQAFDGAGGPRRDKDSDPDTNPVNDGNPIDDETGNGGGDEDDADFAGVVINLAVPTFSPIGLILLMLGLMLISRRRITD
jgi:uncharacterized repeat protein (TIGR01451 family)